MNKKILCLVIISTLIVLLAGCAGIRLLRHERKQNDLIEEVQQSVIQLQVENEELKTTNVLLKEEMNRIEQGDIAAVYDSIADINQEIAHINRQNACIEYATDGFNYLAIGNSITKHNKTYYWWNEIGMAASERSKDYVHLVEKYLKSINPEVVTYAVNFYEWEIQKLDRAETYSIIDNYLSEELDLVTVQLSENVSDITSFKSDYLDLLSHIEDMAPNAQIIIIDDFWDMGENASILREISNELSGEISFVDLTEIKNNTDYICGLGTVVYDDAGNAHTVEHEGVAYHPGDKGMEYYANKIIELIY